SLKVHSNSSKIRSILKKIHSTSIKFAPQTEKFTPSLIFSLHSRASSLLTHAMQFHSITNFPVLYIERLHSNFIKSCITFTYFKQNYTNYQLLFKIIFEQSSREES